MLKFCMLAFAGALALSAQVPQVRSVQPEHGKVGSVVEAKGIYLDKDKVDSLYLSDEKLDLMVKVLSQDKDTIQFRIPPSVKPGRLQLVVKTAGEKGYVLQQPIYIQVEEGIASQAPMLAEVKK